MKNLSAILNAHVVRRRFTVRWGKKAEAMNWEVPLSLAAQVLLINNMYIQIVSVNSKDCTVSESVEHTNQQQREASSASSEHY